MRLCSQYTILHEQRVRRVPKLGIRENRTRADDRAHLRKILHLAQTGARRSYIRQERRALVATAVFHFALKPRAPRILLIRYIRKLIVIRWSRVYTREPPASPSRPSTPSPTLSFTHRHTHNLGTCVLSLTFVLIRDALKPKLPLKRSRRIALKVSAINLNDSTVCEHCMKFGSRRKNWKTK